MSQKEIKDFTVYELTDDGEKEEVEGCEVDTIEKEFTDDRVLLLLRFDLRKLYIWKGPRAPVRKRFISSRVSAGIQSDNGKIGVHLKIISVDAGDEPVVFLKAFDLDPYEAKEEKEVEDMYYVRNRDKEAAENAEIQAKLDARKKKSEPGEYYSPALDASIKFGDDKKADIAAQKQKAAQMRKQSVMRQMPTTRSSSPMSSSRVGMSQAQEKAILDDILALEIEDGLEKLNIIIGTTLYGASESVSKVFGKEVKKTEWAPIKELPDDTVNIEAQMIKAFCKDNSVKGLIILKKSSGESKESGEKVDSKTEEKSEKTDSKKRELPEIPRG